MKKLIMLVSLLLSLSCYPEAKKLALMGMDYKVMHKASDVKIAIIYNDKIVGCIEGDIKFYQTSDLLPITYLTVGKSGIRDVTLIIQERVNK